MHKMQIPANEEKHEVQKNSLRWQSSFSSEVENYTLKCVRKIINKHVRHVTMVFDFICLNSTLNDCSFTLRCLHHLLFGAEPGIDG